MFIDLIEWAKFKISDEVVEETYFSDKKGLDMNASLAKAM